MVAVLVGMITATGGGVIRDVLTNTQPMILSGQLYATAARFGALCCASLSSWGIPELPAAVAVSLGALLLRGAAIGFDMRMGPPGSFPPCRQAKGRAGHWAIGRGENPA